MTHLEQGNHCVCVTNDRGFPKTVLTTYAVTPQTEPMDQKYVGLNRKGLGITTHRVPDSCPRKLYANTMVMPSRDRKLSSFPDALIVET